MIPLPVASLSLLGKGGSWIFVCVYFTFQGILRPFTIKSKKHLLMTGTSLKREERGRQFTDMSVKSRNFLDAFLTCVFILIVNNI